MNHVDQGGAALALYDLIYEIKKNPEIVPVVITGKRNNLNRMLSDIGVENYCAQFKNFMSSYKEPATLYKILLKIRYMIGQCYAIREIEKVIDFSTVDIIHSNLNRIDIGAILAKKNGIPHVWHIREHADGRDFTLVSVMKDPIAYMNSFDSYFISISESVKRIWGNKGLRESKEFIIYDGIREELYRPLPNKRNFKLKMIFLGGYAKSKGQEHLIDALAELPVELKNKFEICFYGNGDKKYIEYLRKKVDENGLSKSMVLNSYQEDIWKHVPDFDVGLTCSHVEGFGRITVEYMMSGLCPIASNGGATPEIVKHGETGILYEAFNTEALRNAVVWAIKNRDTVSKMGMAAAEYAKKQFTMKQHAKKINELYNQILAGNKNGQTDLFNYRSGL